jgi:hypothetical protein
MTEWQTWEKLCKEFDEIFRETISFPLFKHGCMRNDMVDQYEILISVRSDVERRMEEFIAAHT